MIRYDEHYKEEGAKSSNVVIFIADETTVWAMGFNGRSGESNDAAIIRAFLDGL